MVPVLDSNKKPLMPCSEKRARRLMEKGEARPYWQKGVFCIKLVKEPSNRKYQPIALGIDPGSKREGYTVATRKRVVMNVLTNTPNWVKKHLETRRNLRRSRRQRKTPYRVCRKNRATLRNTNRIPPSTRARWGAKLRITKQLLKILPITIVNVEDIKAVSKKGQNQKRWNQSFSPLEVGKNWFYKEIKSLGVKLKKTEGYITKLKRDKRGFEKSKKKLDDNWECHNVDSHCLCEIALRKNIVPYKGLIHLEFLEHYRRQLHKQVPTKKGIRKQYGSTVSLGLSRGTVVRYKDKLGYVGGNSNGKLTVHDLITKKRDRSVNKSDVKVLYISKWRINNKNV